MCPIPFCEDMHGSAAARPSPELTPALPLRRAILSEPAVLLLGLSA
jgi:hypothetical protein